MELLHRCREHAHEYFCDLLVAAEKTLNDALFEQAEKCSNNQEQRRYFEAMQELKSRGDALHSGFRSELTRIFQTFQSGEEAETTIDDQIDIEKLSLVQREELEDEIAISVIVSKSNSRNSEALWKLNRRLAVLRGGKPVTDETNPFGPAAVCRALQTGIQALHLESKAKIFIYRQLGKILVISFSKELDALNDLLVGSGILPNLKFTVTRPKKKNAATGTSGTTTAAAGKLVESDTAIANQQQLYHNIRNLQLQTGPRTHTAGGVSLGALAVDGTPGVDSFLATDYEQILSTIHQADTFLSDPAMTSPLPFEAVEEALLRRLAELSSRSDHHKMTQEDANTIDLVGMIFRYMLDDPNLHDSVKSMLSHLHTPYLKLALLDKTFLDNYQHSARLLLNALADVGGRWVTEDNDRSVLPKIKAVVETILSSFTDDTSLFDHLLEDFSRYRENLEKRSNMAEKRNREAQQGLERLELARQQSREELELRFGKAALADRISEVLLRPWTDFLAFNLLRHGQDSLTWQSALKVVDSAIDSATQAEKSSDQQEMERRRTDFTRTVSEGLATIGYDPEASQKLLNSLEEVYQLITPEAAATDTSESAAPETPTPEPEAARAPTADIPQPQTATEKPSSNTPKKLLAPETPPLTEQEQTMVEKLREIDFGTWFEFDLESSVKLLKLAWFSRVTRHYMFVDQAGIKQAVKQQADLAKGMCEGTIRIAQPTKKSFMERALTAVLEKLKLA